MNIFVHTCKAFKMAQANFGKASTDLYNQNGINDVTYNYCMALHEKSKEAKHDDWSSGEAHLLPVAETLKNNGAISDNVQKYIEKINTDANKGKHKW